MDLLVVFLSILFSVVLGGGVFYVAFYRTGIAYDLPGPEVSLKGKVAIVTGANAGIGKSIATELARRGARVILACRSQERAEKALKDIESETGSTTLEFWKLDLCSLQSVRDFVEKWGSNRVDLLINNAGVLYMGAMFIGDSPITLKTPDGDTWGVQFTANYLGHFLLTSLMLPALESSAGRIVNLTSSTHRFSALNFDDIHGLQCGHFASYSRSKLAIIYSTYELSRRLATQGSQVVCNAVHPGYIASDIVSYLPGPVFALWHFVWVRIMGWDTNVGARGPLVVALHPDLRRVSGKYFSQWYQTPSSSISYDQNIAKHLWDISKKLVGLDTAKKVIL